MGTLTATSDAAVAPAAPALATPITAIVPVRDEEATIEACIRSLARQPEIAEIIVVNDHSTDRTAEIVRNLGGEIKNLQLLDAPDVPAGWLGKNFALWEGVKHASTEWLLFTDADAELQDGAATRAVRIATENGAALVSFSPEQLTQAWYEKALIPFVYFRLAQHFPYQRINDPASPLAAANGQFLMILRDVYDAIGGHQSVTSEVLEDVALAKRVKAAHHPIWFGSSQGAVRVRMYRSFDAMWQGWTKNLYQLVGGTPAAVCRELLLVVPWVSIALLLIGLKLPVALAAGVGLLLARHAVYASSLLRNQFRGMHILYYIPALFLYAGVLWASYRAYARGQVDWKGRRIHVRTAS
jgi:hypothetical protein